MFKLHIPSLGRGAIHTSLIAVAAAAVGAFLSATITHNATIPKASASHEIAPIDPTCTSSLPCIEYDNNGTGPGIRGISVSGNGLAGATKNVSTSATNGRAGLIGNDVGTGTFNSGVHGLSVNGTGVSGVSTSGVGVTAQSTNAQGLNAISTTQDGIRSFTSHNSTTSGSGRSGVFGQDISSDGGHLDAGVAGFSNTGVGVVGLSNNWVGVNAVGGIISTDFFPALSVVGNNSSSTLIDACATANPWRGLFAVFEVDGFGDLFANGQILTGDGFATAGTSAPRGGVNITGQYQKNNSCVAGCTVATAASAGRAVVTYAPMVSQPTIEDFGEAQLVNGQASVRLDPKFANIVDQRANYLVFITPEGDANVLYVTQKSAGGFSVRESHGGRSTIAFSYRIVAKPFGSHEARLPMVELAKLHSGFPKQARRFHP